MIEYQWAHGFWFGSTNASSFFSKILWKLWRCQRKSVSVVCVFLFDGRSVDAKSMRCSPEMLFSPQKRCYGDKYLAQSILQSNNEVTQSCCEKAVICTVPFYHLARHHHWIRPLLLKRNFKARVLTAGEKLYSWCHVGLSGFPKCPIFCQC